jgi:hypothetical protein
MFLLPFEIALVSTSPINLTYLFRFAFTIPLCITIGLWLIVGMPGFSDMIGSTKHRMWLVFGICFAVWMVTTRIWAYDPTKVFVLQVAFQFSLGFTFVVVVLCHPPPLRWMSGVIITSLAINSIVGITQTLMNDAIGLEFLGEPIDFMRNSKHIATLSFMGHTRLRSFGLTSNPNILGGLLITQLFWCAILFKQLTSRRLQYIVGGVSFLGLLALFTSFSRGAWVGFVGASLLVFLSLPKDWHKLRSQFKRFLPIVILAGIGISMTFGPSIIQRFSLSGVGTELDNPISARFIHSYIAWEAVKESPIVGIGAGSSKYYSWRYGEENITFPFINDYPHNILLYILEESGLVGLVLWTGMLSAGLATIIHYDPHKTDYDIRLILLGGALAMLIAGIFDHYPARVYSTQILWMVSLGYAMSLKPLHD